VGDEHRGEWFPGHAAPVRARERSGGDPVGTLPGLDGDGIDPEDPPGPLGGRDDERFWVLDFHFPRGLTPLGLTTFPVAYAAGTIAGARLVGAAGSDGLSIRALGPHLLVSPRVPSPDEQARRESSFDARLAELLAAFPARWAAAEADLDRESAALLHGPCPDVAALLEDAVAHERRAWRVHFEEMYVLLAGHLRYRAQAAALGVDHDLADACLAGFPTRITRSEEALFALAAACREAGLAGPGAVGLAVRDDAVASGLAALLDEYGDRADGVADVAEPSWYEDPTRPLERALRLAAHPAQLVRHTCAPDDRRAAARAEARATASDPVALATAIAAAEHTNWIWWNEEHNAVIDLRATSRCAAPRSSPAPACWTRRTTPSSARCQSCGRRWPVPGHRRRRCSPSGGPGWRSGGPARHTAPRPGAGGSRPGRRSGGGRDLRHQRRSRARGPGLPGPRGEPGRGGGSGEGGPPRRGSRRAGAG
jgi:hypothetical protein